MDKPSEMSTAVTSPSPETSAVAAALTNAAARFAKRLADGDATSPVAGLDWNVRELAVHVAYGFVAYAAMVAGEASPLTTIDNRHEASRVVMDQHASASLADCAAAIKTGARSLSDLVAQLGSTDVRFYEHRGRGRVR